MDLFDVGDPLADVARAIGVEVLRVHLDPFVVHADHGDFQPLIAGHTAQGRQSVHRRTLPDDGLLVFRFEDSVLPAHGIRGPRAYVLIMQQRNIKVIGIGKLAQLVDLRARVHAVAGGHFGHQAVRIARQALECDSQHAVHVAIAFGGFEKADSLVVGVAHLAGELILPQLALYPAAYGPGPECEPRHLDAGFSERHPIGGGSACRP